MTFRISAAVLLLLAPAAAPAAAPEVVVSIRPLHSIASSVMHGVATPRLLLQGTESPHTYALRPSDARMLATADLVVWIGGSIEAFLAQAVHTREGTTLTLAQREELDLLPYRQWSGGHDHDHGHGHDHGEAQADGHLWLDPVRAQALADLLAETLADLDPGRESIYRANAAALRARLASLHEEGVRMLAPVAARGFVVLHDSLQYLSVRYGLTTLGVVQISAGHAPSARHLSSLIETVRARDGACLLAEPQFPSRTVETIAGDLGVRTGVFDPIGMSHPPGPELYFGMMRENFTALRRCLEGPAP